MLLTKVVDFLREKKTNICIHRIQVGGLWEKKKRIQVGGKEFKVTRQAKSLKNGGDRGLRNKVKSG